MNASIDGDDAKPLPSGHELALPWHLRLPEKLELEFRQYLLEDSRPIIRSGLWLVLLLFIGGTAVEFLVDNSSLLLTWRARLLSVLAVVPIWLAASRDEYRQWIQSSVALFALILGAANDYAGVIIDHPLSWSYFLVNLLAILLMSTLFKITLHWAAGASLILFLMLVVSLQQVSHPNQAEMLVIFFVVFSGAVLSLTGHYFFERLQRKHFVIERMLSQHRNELHSANIALENQATEDPLTGTVNRRGMQSRLTQLIEQARSTGESDSLFLLLFDIDFFKQYNDTYGHLAGDDCLKQVASVPKSLIQNHQDFVARYGGEEFVVVLAGIHMNDALVFADRLRNRIEKLNLEHKSSRVSDVVTISVGVAGMTAEVKQAEQLIARADEALYQAKGAGRNRTVVMGADDKTSAV